MHLAAARAPPTVARRPPPPRLAPTLVPATAEPGSLRQAIFANWRSLGLKAEPDVGDNGVHASASPFEALAERLNWMVRSAPRRGVALHRDDGKRCR